MLMCLALEIIMAIGGLLALASGRLKVIGSHTVKGGTARIVGLVLMAPLIFGLAMGSMVASSTTTWSLQEVAGWESCLVIGALILAVIIAMFDQEIY